MTEWREATIAELCSRTMSGGTPSRQRPEFFCKPPDGIPWVRSQELIDRRIERCGEHITESGLKGSSAKLAPRDSILVAMYGATVGHLGYLDIEAATNQAICVLVTDPDATDPRFLYYALMQERSRLIEAAHGAAQQNLSQATIRGFSICVPEVRVQRRISAVLGALDDLIENNRRRVEVLEEMARAIYREWFVHFRYPGHEDVPLVDSPLGPIPDGWRVTTVGEAFEVVLGGTPSRKRVEFWTDGTVPWVTSTRVNDLRVLEPSELITAEALRSCNAKVMPKRSTLIAITGATLGQVSALEIEACANQSVVGVVDVDGAFAEYLYLWFKANIGGVISHASGSAQQHINKGTVVSTQLVLPARGVLDAFKALAAPTFDLIADLMAGEAALVTIRQLLLPALVTGQIDVSHLDLDALSEAATV